MHVSDGTAGIADEERVMSNPSESTIEDMRKLIRRMVAGGFRSAADIKTEGVEVFAEGDNRATLRPISERITE
jgi:hypothetical protein